MYRKIPYIIALLLFTVYTSCVKEVAIPVTTAFSIEVLNNDYSVPVKVRLTNTSKGADTYKWTFEGATPNSSTSKNPGIITYEKQGTYTIKLEASNRDDNSDVKEITIDVKATLKVGFETTTLTDTFSPVSVQLKNTTVGATNYQWTFEGGTPSSSSEKDPGNVVFATPGKHTITLKVGNELGEFLSEEKTITVAPYLVTNFDYQVAFDDDDMQAPVKIRTSNTSVSATKYEWTFEGGKPSSSSEKEPEVVFTNPGTYTITLKASNGKAEKTLTKKITVVQNTNIREFNDVKLGISSAHNTNTIGAFFSTQTRKVYTANEITDTIAPKIDIAFFGLNTNFSFTKFISPDAVQTTAFSVLTNATHTKFINKLETCKCGVSLSVNDFDAIKDDTLLRSLSITETQEGLQEFNNTVQPRIVVFETHDKRKGAIKIKRFVANGTNSYVLVDIKVQKEAK